MMICAICGKPAECQHHLIFGRGLRDLAEDDDLKIPLCNGCHNMASKTMDKIHDNPKAEALSKMLGQAMWESQYVAEQLCEDKDRIDVEYIDARIKFMERYGRSWL